MVGGPYQLELPFLIMAETPIHAGAAPATQFVDIPIQRDVVTGFPLIKGSELKGAFAQKLFYTLGVSEKNYDLAKSMVFGSSPGERGGGAGSFNVLDAHILLLPVPSLYGVHAFVTCPFMLNKFAKRVKGLAPKLAEVANSLASAQPADGRVAVIEENSELVGKQELLYLHPLVWFKPKRDEAVNDFAERIQQLVKSTPLEVCKHVAVLSDDAASYVLDHALLVQPRVRLDYEKKSVKEGPWREEALPRHTILNTSIFIAWEGRLRLELSFKSEEERSEAYKRLMEIYERLTKAYSVNFDLSLSKDYKVKVALKPSDVVQILLSDKALILGGDFTVGRGLLRIVEVGGLAAS